MGLIIHIDGGARGNPGPAGAGVVIADDAGRSLHEAGYFLGRQTNNAAEYQALILALERAARLADPHLTIYSDSELLVHQITGQYRVKSRNLIGYVEQAQLLLLRFDSWTIRHVRREANQRADQLANIAMDRERDAFVYDVDGETSRDAEHSPPPASECAAAPADSSDSDRVEIADDGGHTIHVVVATPPDPKQCPGCRRMFTECMLQSTLPEGMCLHAAHSLLPTVLAMNNTDVKEFAALPTVTVRCIKAGCGAAFLLSPVKSPNGVPKNRAAGK